MQAEKKTGKNKGFTFIELVFVLALLVILIGITAPNYVRYLEKAQMSADASNLSDLATAVKVATVDEEFDVTEGTYIFTLEREGLLIDAYRGNTYLRMRTDQTDGLARGLQNFFGSEWIMDGITSNTQVRLKCKKWLDEAKSTEKVQLVCVVSGHKVAATYKPEKLAEYMATAKTGSVNKK